MYIQHPLIFFEFLDKIGLCFGVEMSLNSPRFYGLIPIPQPILPNHFISQCFKLTVVIGFFMFNSTMLSSYWHSDKQIFCFLSCWQHTELFKWRESTNIRHIYRFQKNYTKMIGAETFSSRLWWANKHCDLYCHRVPGLYSYPWRPDDTNTENIWTLRGETHILNYSSMLRAAESTTQQ